MKIISSFPLGCYLHRGMEGRGRKRKYQGVVSTHGNVPDPAYKLSPDPYSKPVHF